MPINGLQKFYPGYAVSNRVSHTHTTSLGPVLAGLHFWEKMGTPKLLETLGFNELQRKTAAALVLNRLDDPVSEHAMPEWLACSSLPDLLGCYVLRTNHDELDGEPLWTLYMTLAKAEEGFRMLKSDLGLRPNHHQLDEREDL